MRAGFAPVFVLFEEADYDMEIPRIACDAIRRHAGPSTASGGSLHSAPDFAQDDNGPQTSLARTHFVFLW